MSPDVSPLRIGPRVAGAGAPLFVIAEIGLNHGGSTDRALALVDAAADAGASAVKLQTLDAAALVAPGAPAPAHVPASSLVDFFRRFELDEDAHAPVAARARERGLAFMATPFSEAAVDLLERVGVDAYKIASGDITWEALIARAARTGKPLVISTGMATLDEAERAVHWATSAGSGGDRAAALRVGVSGPVRQREPARHRHAGRGLRRGRRAVRSRRRRLCRAPGGHPRRRHLRAPSGARRRRRQHRRGRVEHARRTGRHRAGHRPRRRRPGQRREAVPAGRTCQPHRSRRALHARRWLPAGHVVAADDVIALRPGGGLGAERLRDLVGARLARPVDGGTAFHAADLQRLEQGTDHVA